MSQHLYTRGDGLLESFLAKKRAEKANSFISDNFKNGKILDLGCGSFPYFLTTVNVKKKYGIDPAVNASWVKDNSIHLERRSIDDENLPFENKTFDVVSMLAVFEHIEVDRLNFVLREVKRVLKNKGIFIITTPAPWADKLLHLMSFTKLISKEEIHEHKHSHRRKSIENILKSSGFEKNNIRSGFFELGFNMWFVAKK